MLGSPTDAPPADPRSSPKFRVPTLRPVFEGFDTAMLIRAEGFFPVGSLATGGLTIASDAGIAAFYDADLADFHHTRAELEPLYRGVASRIGISGPCRTT